MRLSGGPPIEPQDWQVDMLSYQVSERDQDYVRVKVEGELTGPGWTSSLRNFLENHYVDDGVKRIVLEASNLERLDEDGLATLLHLRAKSIQRGKNFVVEGAQGPVRSRLRVAGILGRFERGN